jgi:hypothetical protein
MRDLELRFRGRIVEQLAAQTYQSPISAIAEMVANGWDADADRVDVTLPAALGDEAVLIVQDTGHGMTFEECQDRYLEVGYDRRGGDPATTSDGGRPLMGRKGIGKFAGFGIADEVTIDTVSEETGERTRFTLDFERLRGDSDEYVDRRPTDIPNVEWWPLGAHDEPKGTRIELRRLKLGQRPSAVSTSRSLARRFLLLERADDFKVRIDNEPMSDADDGGGVQFDFPKDYEKLPEGVTLRDDGFGEEQVGDHQIKWRVVFYPDTIKEEDLRGISVFAHHKMAQSPFLFEIEATGGTEAQAGQAYLSGTVEADFLDDAEQDLISIERQRVDWDNPVARPLFVWGQEKTKELLREWARRRVADKVRLLTQKIAPFSDRLERLPRHERKIVEGAIRNFANIRALTQEQFNSLSEATLTAWEGGRLRELVDDLSQAGEMSETDLIDILAEHQVMTALHMAEAVQTKQRVVQGLRYRVRRRELENAVRDYIAKDPWLIAPAWETFRIEQSLKKLLGEKAAAEFSEDMLRGRVDLVLSSGDHLLVLEFMRPGLKLDRDHIGRFQYYIDAVRAAVEAETGGDFDRVTGYLVADRIEEDSAINRSLQRLADDGMYAKTWETLLDQSTAKWSEFFDILVERSPDDPRIRDLDRVPESPHPGGKPAAGPDDEQAQAA